jgi:hypothetical protein
VFFDAILNFSMLSRGNLGQAFGPLFLFFRATLYRGANPNVSRIGYNGRGAALHPVASQGYVLSLIMF